VTPRDSTIVRVTPPTLPSGIFYPACLHSYVLGHKFGLDYIENEIGRDTGFSHRAQGSNIDQEEPIL
jgi:hypothetical protein